MNILLLGGGGREHALSWKLAQSPQCDTLYAAPGNPGIAEDATCVALDAGDHGAVAAFCGENAIELVVIGPEAPLVDGLADSLRTAGVPVFGPSRKAAQLEGSKGFTKDLCDRANIPTGGYVRTTSLDQAIAELQWDWPASPGSLFCEKVSSWHCFCWRRCSRDGCRWSVAQLGS